MTSIIEKKKFRKNNQQQFLLQLEHELFSKLKEYLKNGRKLSAFFRTQSNKLWIYHFKDLPMYKDTAFKFSNSWMRIFIKRRKIKFRENKSVKPLSANEKVEEYLKFLAIMGLQVLQLKNKYDIDNPLSG